MCYRVGDAEGALSFAYATETGRQTGAGRALCTSPFPHSLSPFVVWQHQGSLTWRIALPSSLRWWRYQKVRMEWDELMCACRYIGVCVWVGGLEGCPLISVPEAANISHPLSPKSPSVCHQGEAENSMLQALHGQIPQCMSQTQPHMHMLICAHMPLPKCQHQAVSQKAFRVSQ